MRKNAKSCDNERRFCNSLALIPLYLCHAINRRHDMEPERRIKIAAAMQRMVYVVFALFIVLFIIYLTN